MMSDRKHFVYILASKRNGTLYIGVTNNLRRRISEHWLESIHGFTQRHHVHLLVYFESFDEPGDAIAREKQLKAGSRLRKIRVIERLNPEWRDLMPNT